jgi:hypothetical protein
MLAPNVTLRAVMGGDLQAINTVIDRTVMSWGLPERIKRLALPV